MLVESNFLYQNQYNDFVETQILYIFHSIYLAVIIYTQLFMASNPSALKKL